MGVETRRVPKPPAATDDSTELDTPREEDIIEEADTDLSRRTDQTHWSVPEDGSPVDIPIPKKRGEKGRGTLTRGSNKSQTSLLIEYFEGGKGPNVHSRPSVRVKVTPSAARKIRKSNEHIRVSESRSTRRVSSKGRVLEEASPSDLQSPERFDDESLSGSYTSAAEQSSLAYRKHPVDVEVMRGDGSDLSGFSDPPIHHLASDVSSIPPDSMLEGVHGKATPPQTPTRGTTKDTLVMDTLKTPQIGRSRSVSKERLAQKAMEKLAARPRDVSSSSGKHRRSSKTRSRSINEDNVEKPRRRSAKNSEDVDLQSGNSSLLTNSALSPRRPSGDQESLRSGTSKSSINANPRLLETVENAIRRLILPELENMRQEQRMQKSRHKFEDSSVTTSSVSRTGETSRKLSKHASAPDVAGKPKVVLNRDEHNGGVVLSGDSVKGRKERRRSRKSDSPSERSFERGMSEETVIRDGEKSSRKKSREGHRLRDAAAAGIAGGALTAAALNHHDMKHSDSRSSLDRRERRRRRSKSSHSRSASIAETEEIFHKHDVPPMPMRSDIHSSDLTRDSILSERTDTLSSPTGEIRTAEVQHVTRGSPREIFSPASRTPTRSPKVHQEFKTDRNFQARGDRTPKSNHSGHSEEEEKTPSAPLVSLALGGAAAAAGAGALGAHKLSKGEPEYDFEPTYHHTNRGLSPIQSVSSQQESEGNRQPLHHEHSSASLRQHREKSMNSSTKSLSSTENIKFDHSRRPKGMNLEPPEDVLDQHKLRDSEIAGGDVATEDWLRREHEKNDQYRGSMDEGSYRDSMVDYNRLTNFTDDSLDAPRLGNVTAGRELQGIAAGKSPDYRGTPVAVESAVASLHDPSVLSVRSKAGDHAHSASLEGEHTDESDLAGKTHHAVEDNDLQGSKNVLETKQRVSPSGKDSPRQSIARSVEESEELAMGATHLPDPNDPMPEIGYGASTESEISTNPSIIRGPIGGPQPQNSEHWPYEPTPKQPSGVYSPQSHQSSTHESLKAAAKGFLGTAEYAGKSRELQGDKIASRELLQHDSYNPKVEDDVDASPNHNFGVNRDLYLKTQPIPSPATRDEGYVSGPHRTTFSPEKAFKDAESWNDGDLPADDPFVGGGHNRHLSTNSGLAHGMGSPLYDSATGEGIDRILSKDIVALMDHLTVRDAQRNARDTEILVTLVRSAAEMRNSFEEMKKFIAEQDDIMVDAGNKQHDRTIQKLIIGGPRPQPPLNTRDSRGATGLDEGDDAISKKRNVFRRALRGLGGRSQTDITRIEERLGLLLAEVQGLKNSQDPQLSATFLRHERSQSLNNLQMPIDDLQNLGDRLTVNSPGKGNRFSGSPSRGPSAIRGTEYRQTSLNRVSTVMEADEELEEHEREVLDQHEQDLLTPTRENRRSESVPLGTPPQLQLPPGGTQSNDQTPKTSTERSRKHKSTSSSFGPKVSRWSKTTASSIGDHFRNGTRKERPFSEASRSGELHQYEGEHYSPQGDDRIRSNDSFLKDDQESPERIREEYEEDEEERAPSPLIPSQVSEGPKYSAVRNSVNLQHPQPRPGPTHRYQHHLETQAQSYIGSSNQSPVSPTSDTFGSDPALARYMPVAGQRYSGNAGNLSPISDGGYSEHSASEQAAAPPRPPKVKDDGPLVPSGPPAAAAGGPPRPPKLATKDNRPTYASPLSNEHLRPDQRYSGASASNEKAKNESPRSTSSQNRYSQSATPQRKPTGPRPIVSSGSYKPRNSPGAPIGTESPDRDIAAAGVRRTRYRGSPNPLDSPSFGDDKSEPGT